MKDKGNKYLVNHCPQCATYALREIEKDLWHCAYCLIDFTTKQLLQKAKLYALIKRLK